MSISIVIGVCKANVLGQTTVGYNIDFRYYQYMIYLYSGLIITHVELNFTDVRIVLPYSNLLLHLTYSILLIQDIHLILSLTNTILLF